MYASHALDTFTDLKAETLWHHLSFLVSIFYRRIDAMSALGQ